MTDTEHVVKDDHGREILTVGALRKMLEGTSDEVQLVMDDGDGWYRNVQSVIVPSGDYGTDLFSAVTLMRGEEIDPRQF